MILTLIPSRRGLLIGLTCGLLFALAVSVFGPESKVNGLTGRLAGVFGWGAFGALLGGFVRMTGCLTVAGATIGLIALGKLFEATIPHVDAVAYGIALGGALGGCVGYAFGTRLEWAIAQVCKESPHQPAGMWDRELDG